MTIYNFLMMLPKGGTIVEIGAHNGSDTEWVHKMLKPDHMICFEPDPRNFAELNKRNLPISMVQGAVSDKEGKTKLWMSSGKPANQDHEHTASSSIMKPDGHIKKHPEYNFDKQIEVDVYTLDSVMKVYKEPIKFIWCDAQGSEANIIKGAQETLARTDFFFCEYSDEELYSGQKKLEEWRHTLPGSWEEVYKWDGDILLKRVK